jgi:hypothetical protein
MFKYIIAAVIGGLFGWLTRREIALRDQKEVQIRHETDSYKTWSEAFNKGWESAKDNYTRWYDRDQYKLAFGEDRGY